MGKVIGIGVRMGLGIKVVLGAEMKDMNGE